MAASASAPPRSRDRVAPEVIVIGAMKCGTSSLHYYLDLHPEISMSRSKELNFFVEPAPVSTAPDREIELMHEGCNAGRGPAWYASQFDPQAPVRGESSVAYSFPWYPSVAERIAAGRPDVRLIYVMRHPLERALSHYRQLAARDRRSPAEALLAPGNPYVTASRYATALAPFLAHFPRESVLLVRHEDLLFRRRQTLAEVFSFLGVDSDFDSPWFMLERNRSVDKGSIYTMLERIRSGWALPLVERVPRRARAAVAGVLTRKRSNHATSEEPSLSPEVAQRVLDQLEPEVEEIERISGWQLPEWRRPAASS